MTGPDVESHPREAGAIAPARRTRAQWAVPAIAMLVFAAIWLTNTWSPSHYAIVLRAFGATDVGLVLGKPRGILSDEWGVITPLIQATVNNDLDRYNRTSAYGEDLRTTLSMPLLDWGLAFKPDKWLYPAANAAYAYSFQWLFYLFTFVGGYALLFRRLGSGRVESAALSLALYFTAFVQFWWTVFAPTVSLFPWLMLALGLRNPVPRIAAIAWIGSCWMLGFFYPPQFLPLALVGTALFLALHSGRRQWATAVFAAIGTAIACAIVVFYLRDYLAATSQTVFPGQRRVDGGSMPPVMLAELLWPAAFVKVTGLAKDYQVVNTTLNLAEASAAGTIYTLFVLAFLDYRRAFTVAPAARERRLLVALLVAFGALVAWQTLPIPGRLVAWIGFDRVPPVRSVFASGLALLLLVSLLARTYGLRFGWRRYLLLAALALIGWGITKANGNGSWLERAFPDLLVLPLAAVALAPARWLERHGRPAIAVLAAVWGVIAFGAFNPIQSAWPIFNRPTTPLSQILEARARHHPEGVLVSEQFGATLNGWGFRAATHVLPIPPMPRWHALFPDIPREELGVIFNRFAHIVPIDEDRPRLLAVNVAGVPWARLADPLIGAVDHRPLGDGLPPGPSGGHVDARVVKDGRIHIFGWAPWSGLAGDQRVSVYSDAALKPVRFQRNPRPDVAKALGDPAAVYSGFEIVLAPTAPGAADGAGPVCLVATGTTMGPEALVAEDAGVCRPGPR